MFATFGRHGYPASEVQRAKSLPVSYMIAPVFGPDAQPRYQIVLHLLRPALSRAELAGTTAQLLRAAATLSASIGGPSGASSPVAIAARS